MAYQVRQSGHKQKSNRYHVIVAPNGAFHLLLIDNKGNDIATWLAAHGVTALHSLDVHVNFRDKSS